ncbi:MAG: shikimate kinase [Candidatus Omnitrophota bacterium]
MATGKTSVGKELANRLKKKFLDLDDIIEQREEMRIVDIFREKGEAYFRKIEKDLVKKISQKTDLVVGCGGGAVVNEENLANLKKSGVIICLKADIDTILKRAQGTEQRPLLNVDDRKPRISELLKRREPFYDQADNIIDTTNLSIKEVVDKVISILENKDI